MAEAVAAFYAVETAVEGAALGAYAASRPTVPLHIRFRKLTIPSSVAFKASVGQSLNIIKSKAYLFGGQDESNAVVKVMSLPIDLDKGELDFNTIEPQVSSDRPLQPYSDEKTSDDIKEQTNKDPEPRSGHSSAAIDHNIYILAGGRPQGGGKSQLLDCDRIDCFSTQISTWSTIECDKSKSVSGIPSPRENASCTSTPHPAPESALEINPGSHGTIFLHGGYDAQGQLLRDTWSFDVSSRTWTKLPDIPDPSSEEIAGEGRIKLTGATLCRLGDGFGKAMFLDFDFGSDETAEKAGAGAGEPVAKARSDSWAVKSFVAAPPDAEVPVAKASSLPMPRKDAGLLPITTGAGRYYLLYFFGQDGPESFLPDVWSFQITPEEKTPASLKDTVRQAVGAGTGNEQWAQCKVTEKNKDEEELPRPHGLSGFASDVWTDFGGGHAVIFGGKGEDGQVKNEGWILSVE